MNAQPMNDDLIRFWRMFNDGILAGQPIGRLLQNAARELSGTTIGQPLQAVHDDVMQREQNLSDAMRKHPDVFDPRLIAAVEAGEIGGILDRITPQIVEALQAGDLDRIEASGILLPREACEYVSGVLQKAFVERGTDIHFEPFGPDGARVRIRVDGLLHVVDPPAEGLLPKVISYLKMMGAMDPANRHEIQNGVCDMPINRENLRLRINVVPTHDGEQATVCMLRKNVDSVLMGLEKLDLSEENLQRVRRLMHVPHGMVIASGPADCGKTTLLYSILKELDSPQVKIITVEDPVEIAFAGMGQIQNQPQTGLTYARVIRAMLHQAPNIMMVGEILDLEAANLCVQVALTGHLLLTTLHTDTTVGAIARLMDMGVEPYLVSGSLAGVVTSRLVRRLCPDCRRPAEPVQHALPKEAREWIDAHPEATFYEPKGCDKCGGLGSIGRTAIHEVLVMTDRLRQMVTDGAPLSDLRAAAVEEGTKPMLIDGLEKAAAGVTTIQDVLAAIPLGAQQ